MNFNEDEIESEFRNYDGKISYAEIAKAYEKLKNRFVRTRNNDIRMTVAEEDDFRMWFLDGPFALERDIATRMIFELGKEVGDMSGQSASDWVSYRERVILQ